VIEIELFLCAYLFNEVNINNYCMQTLSVVVYHIRLQASITTIV